MPALTSITRIAIIFFMFGLLPLSGCSLFSSGSNVEWSQNQERPIVQITDCCGFVPQITPLNYIPDAQIWGDGRFIWVEELGQGERQVLQGELSQNEIEDFLQRLVQNGFFQWRDEYADYSVTDLPWTCINVELIRTSKSVCEYYRGAPAAFHSLYGDLANGLDETGRVYSPDRAYLTTFQVEGIELGGTQLQQWDSDATGVALSEALDGTWIEGAALQRAWAIVNADPFGNMVESSGGVYQLAVQIPGVSMLDPGESRD